MLATLISTLPTAINSRSSIKKITFNSDCLHSNHIPEKKSSLKQLHPKISLILHVFDYMYVNEKKKKEIKKRGERPV